MVVSETKSPANISVIKDGDPPKIGDDLSSGKDLNLGIVNQYGQLMGDYSKLDDELWLSKPIGVDNVVDESNDEIQCQIVPFHENLDEQVQKSDHVDGIIISVNENSSTLKHIFQNQSQISSPVSVLQNRQTNKPIDQHSLGGVQSLGTTKEQSQGFESDQSEYSIGSSLLNDSEDSIPTKNQVRTRKISDLLDLNLEPPKKCLHCETSETPQWRTGPMGRKTLCNACGVQYKHGRLFPDYRPLKSPTFDPSLHSNFPKKVQETRMGKSSEMFTTATPKPKKFKGNVPIMDTSLHSDSGNGIQEVRVRYTSERYPHLTSNPEKVKKTTQVVEDTSLRSILEKKVQDMIMSSTSNKSDQNKNSDPKNDEMRLVFYNEVQSRAERAKKFQEMREKVSDVIPLAVDNSSERDQKSPAKENVKQKKPLKATQKCLHCEATKTPQWREGPMGRNTLCNACGVQYRHGRLFPEYCPLKSPKYNPSLHSHMPKKVLEMRMKKEKCASSTTNFEEGVGVSSME